MVRPGGPTTPGAAHFGATGQHGWHIDKLFGEQCFHWRVCSWKQEHILTPPPPKPPPPVLSEDP